MKTLKSFFIATVLIITLLSTCTYAATFEIQNNCSDTVWAAAVPGGGRKLYSGETWTLEVANGTAEGRIWARTNCTFNANGRGSCQTGDCGGVLQCTAYGTPPITLAEYALNQHNNLDFLDISLLDGFNVPMTFSRPSDSCTGGISCSADIYGQCPDELRAPGGCNNPCTVFKTDQYCCVSGGNCGPTNYSRFFKDRCPDAYSYPKDEESSTFTCPVGSKYRVVFCPETFQPLQKFSTFQVRNDCPYTVWAAAVPVGGGQRLDSGETWTIQVPFGTTGGRIWARTNCTFDTNGRGSCQTGDCRGVFQCTAYGTPPNTLAEFALNQFNNLDFFDISLVDGFNVPIDFGAASIGCTSDIRCTADINGQCPDVLRAPGGCNNPCTVFKTDQYCCNSGSCSPTDYSMFFKDRCPDAYSYPKDDQTGTFTCPEGNKYWVVFCP